MIYSAPLSTAASPLPPEERDRLLDRVAAQVTRRGLAAPAVLFLELNRPLGFLAGQATHLLAPFLAGLIGIENVRQLASLLEEPANFDRLLDRIEQHENERNSAEHRNTSP